MPVILEGQGGDLSNQHVTGVSSTHYLESKHGMRGALSHQARKVLICLGTMVL
jgi:hypothetical protein